MENKVADELARGASQSIDEIVNPAISYYVSQEVPHQGYKKNFVLQDKFIILKNQFL